MSTSIRRNDAEMMCDGCENSPLKLCTAYSRSGFSQLTENDMSLVWVSTSRSENTLVRFG